MTGVIATIPKYQFSSTTGAPLVNGTLTVYVAGSTTPTNTWQDAALSVLNTNPIQLDSRGECVLWLNSSVTYKFVLKNEAGVIQWTQDNISGAARFTDLAAASGASIVGFIQAGTGAVARTAQAKMREWVTVDDFSGLQVAVDSGHTLIRIPQGVNVATTANISLPAGVNLQVDGIISGTGRLDFVGSCKLFGCGSITCGSTWSISVAAGAVSIKDLTIGKAATNGILVFPTATITSLRIQDCTITGAQYGILRNVNGTDYAVLNAHISGNTITDSTGDGIEWNVCHLDRRVKIHENIVLNTNGSVVNSGIGIGVAGKTYSHTSDLSGYVQQVEVTDNTVRGARQGIHVEVGAKFVITGNKISDITASYGDASITTYAIIVYAAEQAQISDNFLVDNTSGIAVHFGVIGATFTGSPRDVVVTGNTLIDSGSIHTRAARYSAASVSPLMVVKGNTVIRGGVIHQGACNLVIDANTVKSAAGVVGFTLDYYYASVGASYLPLERYLLKITNNQVFDEINRVNVSISNVSQPTGEDGNFGVFQSGNSFVVPVSDTAFQSVNRVIYSSEAGLGGVPYGVELDAGTLVIDTATPARYLVTVSGSRNKATDTYSIVDAASGYIRSTNYNWRSGSNHTVGQAITLTGGIVVNGYVGRVLTASAEYRMLVVDATGATLNLTTLTAGTITATNPLTAVTI